MSDEMKYRVLPRPTTPRPIPEVTHVELSDYDRKQVEGLNGCAGLAIALVIAVITTAATRSPFAGIVVAGVLVGVFAMMVKSGNTSALARKRADEQRAGVAHSNQADVDRARQEATWLTQSLTQLYKSSSEQFAQLPQLLNQARSWLLQAETEYQESAFGPFWDAVENAAGLLAKFDANAKQLSKNAVEYYRGLDGREHTFPAFPANRDTIPNPSSVLGEMRRVVRQGQTNFQFANIWEHRRTREVMIAGFQTLGEAVNNLGAAVEQSVANLEQSVSSDNANLIQEGIRTRDALDHRMLEQNRMLDNIQRREEPGPGDRPSRY
jgi:hypothetical protein